MPTGFSVDFSATGSGRNLSAMEELEDVVPCEIFFSVIGGGLLLTAGGLEDFMAATIGLLLSFKLLIVANASGVSSLLALALVFGKESFSLPLLLKVFLLASASGVDVISAGFCGRTGTSPLSFLACMAAFCASSDSLSSSTRLRSGTPPVIFSPDLPRRILSLSVSGAT
jgi:hypothetical protein